MISQSEYQKRRKQLAKQLSAGSIACIPAASLLLRNGDAHYRFRQDSDFYYLTGFQEPEALLLVSASGQSVLLNQARHFSEEQWSGKRLGQEGAIASLGVDEAYPISAMDDILPQLLADKTAVYFPLGRYPRWDKKLFQIWQKVKGQVRQGVNAPQTFTDIAPILGEMRLLKSAAEIALMREAGRVTVLAHQQAMRTAQDAHFEYQLEAALMQVFYQEGARDVAYDSIVAGGSHACTLHYTRNDAPLRRGDLVLIDAGGEVHNYAADVTRTFPVNGTYSAEQRSIYALVLAAQKAGMQCIRPGCLWNSVQQAIIRVITEGLKDLGLLKGTVDTLIETEAYKPFYMHQSGHWLGLDVHDVGRYKIDGQWRALDAGMVLTVEPGIYIHEAIPGVDSRWHGIGVRIEDDICVTPAGYENFTAALPVEVDDIEALMRGG